MFMVPSHLRQLLSGCTDLSRKLKRLRAVTVGGETLTRDLAVRLRELLPHVRLFNAYGGSETGSVAIAAGHRKLARRGERGRTARRKHARLSPRSGHESCPAGRCGRNIRGLGHVSRGYLHRPDLTALQYVPDPFGSGDSPDGFTGRADLGRHLPDGTIEFLGRADRQVKVRGFRVELEEIEAVLHDSDHVYQAVVTAQETGSDNRLIAYVVLERGPSPGVSGLQSFLRQRLPDYMVPAAFVILDRIPFSERKNRFAGFAGPGPERPAPGQAPGRLRGIRSRRRSAEIWSGVLGLETVGIH